MHVFIIVINLLTPFRATLNHFDLLSLNLRLYFKKKNQESSRKAGESKKENGKF